MNEYEIALKKVLPHIRAKLNWPDDLISPYGRVPVQIGTSTVWADFVFYISKNQKACPWLLVEVKKQGVPLEQALPQAESYSLIIGAPYFCVTDGDEYGFYMTGDSQGKSIQLKNLPPVPVEKFLDAKVENIVFPPQIDDLVELFVKGLREEERFFDDTAKHCMNPVKLHEIIFTRIDSLKPQELKEAIDQHMMIKTPNKNQMYSLIDADFNKFKEFLKFIKDIPGDIKTKLDDLLDSKNPLNLKGAGIFFITQMLDGAHPNEFVVLEEGISNALLQLGITDILVKNDTSNGYIYVNEICKKLFKDKLERPMQEFGFGLPAVHNFLWHYYMFYLPKKKWYP